MLLSDNALNNLVMVLASSTVSRLKVTVSSAMASLSAIVIFSKFEIALMVSC